MKISLLRGVNLGGWLVSERWIAPSLFSGTSAPDEYSLVQELGPKAARQRLEAHWWSFITETDIKQIKKLGLNAVRLPVGYWLFEDQDGFLGGSYRLVDKLFDWAEAVGLGVILCLHGAPGSQNGQDHSGRQGKVSWFKSKNLQKSRIVIEQICKRYGQKKALVGVELINEPAANNWYRRWKLIRYYKQAGRVVSREASDRTSIILSDAFQDRLISKIMKLPLDRIVVDTHLYQLFTPEDRALDLAGHLGKIDQWQQTLKKISKSVPVLVGEWSAAMDEQYEPSLKQKARAYTKPQHINFARKQRRAFEASGAGWFYWTARTEDGGVWSLLDNSELIK